VSATFLQTLPMSRRVDHQKAILLLKTTCRSYRDIAAELQCSYQSVASIAVQSDLRAGIESRSTPPPLVTGGTPLSPGETTPPWPPSLRVVVAVITCRRAMRTGEYTQQ
jgi:hypothetical protein